MAFWCRQCRHCTCPWASPGDNVTCAGRGPGDSVQKLSNWTPVACEPGWARLGEQVSAGEVRAQQDAEQQRVPSACCCSCCCIVSYFPQPRESAIQRARVPEIVSFSLNCDTMQQQLALFRRTSFRIVLSLTACCSCRCCCRCIVALNKW